MFSKDDFSRMQISEKKADELVNLFNDFFSDLTEKYSLIRTEDAEEDNSSNQKCIDSLISVIKSLCLDTEFKYYQMPSIHEDRKDIEDGLNYFLSRLKSKSDKAGFYELYHGYISIKQINVRFSVSVSVELTKDNETEVYVSFYPERFKEREVKFLLRNWRNLVPYIEYCLKADYSVLSKAIGE